MKVASTVLKGGERVTSLAYRPSRFSYSHVFGGQIPARYHERLPSPPFTVVIVPCSFLTILLFLLLGNCSEYP